MKNFKNFISGSTGGIDLKLSEGKDLLTLTSTQVSVEPQPCGSRDNPNPGLCKILSSAGIFQMLITFFSFGIFASFFYTKQVF